MSTQPTNAPSPERFVEIQQSPEFGALRKTFRSFAFPLTVAFLAWYLFYIVTATFAVDFVEIRVWGYINLGLVLGILQFVTTGIVTYFYVRWADNKIDPAAEEIRAMAAAQPNAKEA